MAGTEGAPFRYPHWATHCHVVREAGTQLPGRVGHRRRLSAAHSEPRAAASTKPQRHHAHRQREQIPDVGGGAHRLNAEQRLAAKKRYATLLCNPCAGRLFTHDDGERPLGRGKHGGLATRVEVDA